MQSISGLTHCLVIQRGLCSAPTLIFYLQFFCMSQTNCHLATIMLSQVCLFDYGTRRRSLPKYESSHEFQTKKKRQQQRQHEETAKRQKLQHPPQHPRLPPVQQSAQAHAQMRPGPNQLMHGSQPPVAAGPPGHHYGKPRGPSGGAGRYPSGGNPGGGYNHPNRGGQGGSGGYNSGPYPPQGRAPPYGSSGMPGAGPRGGGGTNYGVGPSNYPQGAGPYGGSGAGRGSNMMGGNRNQQYGWQQ